MTDKYCIENDFAAQKELAEMERHDSLMIWEENKVLRAEIAALKEAVKPVVKWWESNPDGIPMRQGATEIMGLMTRKEAAAFDALAAVVEEEEK